MFPSDAAVPVPLLQALLGEEMGLGPRLRAGAWERTARTARRGRRIPASPGVSAPAALPRLLSLRLKGAGAPTLSHSVSLLEGSLPWQERKEALSPPGAAFLSLSLPPRPSNPFWPEAGIPQGSAHPAISRDGPPPGPSTQRPSVLLVVVPGFSDLFSLINLRRLELLLLGGSF